MWSYFVFFQQYTDSSGFGWEIFARIFLSSRFILGSTLFLLFINDLPGDFIFNIAIYADDITLNSKCD